MSAEAHFAVVADVLKRQYGIRCLVNTNKQEITLFEAGTGRVFLVTFTEKRFTNRRNPQ
jgi:hypothetical protein